MNKIFVHNDETNACFTGNRLKISIDHVTITAARGGWLRNGKLIITLGIDGNTPSGVP